MKNIIQSLTFVLLLIPNLYSQESQNVTLLGRWPDGPCQTISLINNIGIIGNGSSIEILDISSPDSIVQLSKLDCKGFVWDIFIDNNLAFIGVDYGILVIDFFNPVQPSIIAIYKTNSDILQLFYQSSKLFFIENDTLKMIEYINSNLGNEYVLFSTNYLSGFFIKDTLAFVNDRDEGLYIIDLNNFLDPEILSLYKVTSYYHNEVYVHEDIAYITTSITYSQSKIQLVDISNPTSPIELGYLEVRGDWSSQAENAIISDTLIYATYLSDVGSGFIIGSVNDPSAPYVINEILLERPDEIIFKQNKVYLSDYYNGLQIFDVTNPNSIIFQGEHKTKGVTYDLSVKDSFIFVANDRSGLRIIDYSNLNDISEVSFFDFDPIGYASVTSVVVKEYLAYLTSWGGTTGGIKIINISNPVNPFELGFNASSYGSSLCVENNIAYISDRLFGMNIFDISDSTNPQKIWQMTDDYIRGTDIFIEDTLAFLAAGWDGFYIFNVSIPESPVFITNIPSLNSALGVYAKGSLLFLADGDAGLRIFDITNPRFPQNINTYNNENSFLKVNISDNYAFVVDRLKGLEILDITDIDNITLKGFYKSLSARNVLIVDSLIFLSEYHNGFSILKTDILVESKEFIEPKPEDFSLSQNYPNPFNPSTNIGFRIANFGLVTLKVYDVLGREVVTLVNEEKQPGVYEVEFSAIGGSASGGDGSHLSSGIYFYKLQTENFSLTKKMILLR